MSQFVLRQVRPSQDQPQELNPEIFGPGLEVHNNRLQVTFVKDGNHENDVGSIQANSTIPTLCTVYFYEMLIKNKGERGKFVIGFTDKRFTHGRMPGWDVGGYGYCGQDGNKLIGQMQGVQYGPTYTEGDVVGAGIHLQKQEIFFTKNNQYLGVACSVDFTVISDLRPTIGLHSKQECVEVNFGAKPFKFDLQGMIEEVYRAEKEQFKKQQSSSKSMHTVVQDYLMFHGYKNTLEKFEGAWGLKSQQQELDDVRKGWQQSLQLRSQIRSLILNDDVDAAVNLLNQFSDVINLKQQQSTQYNDAEFMLHIGKFLEICVRHCRTDNGKSALQFAQQFLSKFQTMEDLPPQRKKLLEDCMSLLMYFPTLPEWLKYLVGMDLKDAVVDAVNMCLLQQQQQQQQQKQQQNQQNTQKIQPLQTNLEKVLQHIVVMHAKMLENNGNLGEVFMLRDFMSRYCAQTVWGQDQGGRGQQQYDGSFVGQQQRPFSKKI